MVVRHPDGRVTFRLYQPEASVVEVMGDFTGWEARGARMTADARGWWTATLPIAPGQYLFSYLVDGSRWVPDYAAMGLQANGYGGWVSQLHVTPGVSGVAA